MSILVSCPKKFTSCSSWTPTTNYLHSPAPVHAFYTQHVTVDQKLEQLADFRVLFWFASYDMSKANIGLSPNIGIKGQVQTRLGVGADTEVH